MTEQTAGSVSSPAEGPVTTMFAGFDTEDADNETNNQDANPPAEDDDNKDVDLKSEVEKWKTEARKHERRAKENAKAQRELQELRKGNLPEQDRMVAEVEERVWKESRAEFGQRLAGAEIRAALTGIVDNPSDIVEDLNLSRYVGDDGEVDEDAVAALKQKFVNLMGNTARKTPKVGHGRSGKPAEPKSAADEFAETINGLLGRG